MILSSHETTIDFMSQLRMPTTLLPGVAKACNYQPHTWTIGKLWRVTDVIPCVCAVSSVTAWSCDRPTTTMLRDFAAFTNTFSFEIDDNFNCLMFLYIIMYLVILYWRLCNVATITAAATVGKPYRRQVPERSGRRLFSGCGKILWQRMARWVFVQTPGSPAHKRRCSLDR